MFKRTIASLSVVVLLAALAVPVAMAHEGREVGEYHFTVGFMNEPAFEGQVNAASVRVTGPGEEQAPVTGLADTLQVEVTHLSTGETREMDLRAVFGDDGHYVADFVPTAPGGYSFRFFGEINGEQVDETFTSGEGTFSEVQPSRDIQFPVQLAETRELQNAVQGAQDDAVEASVRADDAESQAATAMTIGIIGIVVGVIGLGLGGYAVMGASRRK